MAQNLILQIKMFLLKKDYLPFRNQSLKKHTLSDLDANSAGKSIFRKRVIVSIA
jgi:hypothetical protein